MKKFKEWLEERKSIGFLSANHEENMEETWSAALAEARKAVEELDWIHEMTMNAVLSALENK